ncbi:MAG: methionyl-tRNA formyltransferase [Gammaproteobacteria bacterium]
MRVVFAGTPDFSVPVLQALIDADCEVVGVYCQPDRPAGRGRKLQPGPVKQSALDHQLSIYQPQNLKTEDLQQQLRELAPDLIVVVAYGLLLPQTVLDIPPLGCVNLHASLLPRWRGAAPIHRAILAGDSETGVCLMQMEAGLDTGPVLASVTCAISDEATAGELHDHLSRLSAQLLVDNLSALESRSLNPISQDDESAIYAHKLQKKEALVDWSQSAEQIQRQVRGFNPWPVAQTEYQGKMLRLWAATVLLADNSEQPGSVIQESAQGIDVACGTGVLRLLEIQMPGSKRMAVSDFLNARSMLGACLGTQA